MCLILLENLMDSYKKILIDSFEDFLVDQARQFQNTHRIDSFRYFWTYIQPCVNVWWRWWYAKNCDLSYLCGRRYGMYVACGMCRMQNIAA